MLAFLVSLPFEAVVFSIGAGVASAISIIPFSLLERTPPMHGRCGLALLPSGVPAR
jgi:hypothetical protein